MPPKTLLIRMPKEARPLLKFVKASRESDPDVSIFEYFADLFMAGAALGFARGTFKETVELLTTDPGPIEYAVFENRGYHEPLTLMAISHSRDATVAERLEQVGAIAERYAAAGFQLMVDQLDTQGHPSLWIKSWQDTLLDANGHPKPALDGQ